VSRRSGRLADSWREHIVQFYAAEDELADGVGRYLAEGIRSGAGVVVVATAAHRQAFTAALTRQGVDVERTLQAGRLQLVDASALLGGFLDGDRLDHDKFAAAVGGLVGQAAAGGRPVRVYGEMVALLWEAGQVTLAIELEELWNALGARLPFALLCGYPASVLSDQDTADAARDVCRVHTTVADQRSFPAELNSVRAARHYVAALLDLAAAEAVVTDAAIVVTELAANAVVHAHSRFTLTVTRSAAGAKIAVRDHTPLAPPDGEGPFRVLIGHGLSVVSQLARRWAVERLPDGKVVWAELSLAAEAVR